jgi:ADP-ribose pyrophosphatase
VVILPLVDQDQVCLIRNYRVAVGRELIELPAGTLTPGEEPLAAAQRELCEETGYRGGRWERMQTFFPSPGILDERMVLYRASQLTAGAPAREHGEEIENLVVSWDEALRMVRAGKIEDAKTLAGLLLEDQRRRDSAGLFLCGDQR